MVVHPLWIAVVSIVLLVILAPVVVVVVLAATSGRRSHATTAPTFSTDGRWWWDGRAWQPVPQPGGPQPPRRLRLQRPARNSRRTLQIDAVTEATLEVHEALAKLLPQLNSQLPIPTMERLRAIVADPAVTLLLAREGRDVVGTTTVVVYKTPFWIKARLDEVVVDEAARGKGVGEALVNAALDIARTKGAQVAELQSGVQREAANRLYPRMGFKRRETNVYRITLD